MARKNNQPPTTTKPAENHDAKPSESTEGTSPEGNPPLTGAPPVAGETSTTDVETPTDPGTGGDSATAETPTEPAAKPTTEPSPTENSNVPNVATVDVEPGELQFEHDPVTADTIVVGGSPAAPITRQSVAAGEVSIDVVLADIASSMSDSPPGYKHLSPDPQLSPDEAETQLRLYISLAKHGVPLRDQAGVYPWLLRQVARSLRE